MNSRHLQPSTAMLQNGVKNAAGIRGTSLNKRGGQIESY